MKRKRKRNLADDARRARLYRRRKKEQLRRATDMLVRALLQRFYSANGLLPSDWVDVRLFARSSFALGLDEADFFMIETLPTDAIEHAIARTDEGTIKLIRPTYFLGAT
jgi:hypothetical protein